MDNATRRQLLEQAKQVGYTGSILDVFQNPQVLDQFVQQQQVQQQPQQQMPIEMPTPPAVVPNYKVPQPRQSEAQPLVMSNTEVPIQIRKTGGILYENGGPKDKGWKEYKTPTGESLYLDPRFKDQRYYVNEKGDHVTPDQNMSLFDVKDNIWESGTSLPVLEVNDVSHLNKEDAQIINKITKQQQWAKNATGVAEPTFSPIEAAVMAVAAPLTIPSLSTTLSAPLVVGGSTVPGVTLGGTVGAIGGGIGINEFINPEEETNKSIRAAYNNPTWENTKKALINSGISGSNFIGLGMLDASKPLIKNIAKGLNTATESKFIQALNPYANFNINKEIAEYKYVNDDILNNIDKLKNNLFDIDYKEYQIGKYLKNKNPNLSDISQIKKQNRYNKVLQKTKGFELENGNIVSKVGEFDSTLNAGKGEIIDFQTGQKIQTEIELPKVKRNISLEGDEIKDVTNLNTNVNVNPEYPTAVKSNIQYIEKAVPGSKVFGSSTGVGEVNLPHLSHDYDVMISQKNYNTHVKNKLKFVGDTGPAKTHSIGENFGEQGNIDFNIVEEGKNGKATGQRAIEIFRQFFPDEFYKAEKQALKNNKDIEIPYTPDELIAKVDPRVKTVIDAYESSKPKHVNRIDAYLHFGDPDIIIQAQEHFVKSLVGSKGKVGPQYAENLLNNYDTNLKILNEIEFIGNPEIVAKNPKKMQAALNDFYINKTILNRQINTNWNKNLFNFNFRNIESAFKHWKPEYRGGSAHGSGLNHVQLGDSQHGDIISYKQLGLKHYNTPLENIALIKRQTEEAVLDQSDVETIKDIVKSYFGENSQMYQYASKELFTSKDLLYLPVTTVEEQQQLQKIYNEISNKLGIKAATDRMQYGNSKYISTLGDFNEAEDILTYGNRERLPANLNSKILRSEVFNNAKQSTGNPNIVTKKGFKQFEGYLKFGEKNIEKKLQEAYNEQNKITEYVDKLAERIYNTSNKGAKTKLITELEKNQNKSNILNEKIYNLQSQKIDIENIRSKYAIGAAGGLVTVGGIAIAKEMENIEKRTLENRPDQKKYEGKKCYTCNSSKLKVLYNKANYKK